MWCAHFRPSFCRSGAHVGQQPIQEADHTVAKALHYLHHDFEIAVSMNRPTQVMHCTSRGREKGRECAFKPAMATTTATTQTYTI